MKARFAKKIWKRRVDRLPPYWKARLWDYVAKCNRDHRIDKAKKIIYKYNCYED